MSEKKYVLYKHTSPNGKVYIGITCRELVRRCGTNGCGYREHPHFWNAIQKYGWENFKHEILLFGLSKDEACEKEKEFIAKYRSNEFEYGYNLTSGGESGYNLTPEVIIRLTNGLKKKWQDPEYREKVSSSKRGRHFSLSEETKEKMRKPKSEATRAKMRKPKSTETRQKMSEAKKRYFANMTPEQREAFADKFRKHNNETTDTSRESRIQ